MQGKTWVILAGLPSRNMTKERGRVGLPEPAELAEILADSNHGFLSRGCRTWHTFLGTGCPAFASVCLTASELSLLLSLTNAQPAHLHLLCSSAGWSAVIEGTGSAFE